MSQSPAAAAELILLFNPAAKEGPELPFGIWAGRNSEMYKFT